MENITLNQMAIAFGFLVGLIGSVEYLYIRLRKWLKKSFKEELEPIYTKLENLEKQNKELELNSDKNFLVRFLSDVEQGGVIDEIEEERFCETHERYHELGGNSYIDHKVEKLKKEGKL